MYCVNCGSVKAVINKYNLLFRHYFGKSLWEFTDKLFLMIDEFTFDILKFEEYLKQTFDYSEDMSISRFIEIRFGKEAKELINKILEE